MCVGGYHNNWSRDRSWTSLGAPPGGSLEWRFELCPHRSHFWSHTGNWVTFLVTTAFCIPASCLSRQSLRWFLEDSNWNSNPHLELPRIPSCRLQINFWPRACQLLPWCMNWILGPLCSAAQMVLLAMSSITPCWSNKSYWINFFMLIALCHTANFDWFFPYASLIK